MLHATGDVNYEKYMAEITKRGGVGKNIIIKPYLHNMPVALAAADLAVFRAGAIGLAELMAKGVPSVLIPYPYATANHQEFNARAVEAKGAARVILDKELDGEPAILLTSGVLRTTLSRFVKNSIPGLRVLSYQEIPEEKQIKIVSSVGQQRQTGMIK